MPNKHKQAMEWRAEESTMAQLADRTETDKLWNRMDSDQRDYDSKMESHSVVFVDAEAGTGKTTYAVRKALEMLRENKVNKIQYVRFPDRRAGKLGFLPGDLKDGKEAGFMVPFEQALYECGINQYALQKLVEKGKIEMTTDLFLRGTNLKGVFLIIDEAQNASELEDLKLVLTRLHDHKGRGVVIGHTRQTDNKVTLYTKHKLTAFQVTAFHFLRKSWAARGYLRTNYRGEISKWADRVEDSLVMLEGMNEI